MSNGLSENVNIKKWETSRATLCNETALLLEMEECGDKFKWDMELIHPINWCNLTHFIRKYNHFSNCTEGKALRTGCYWPNPVTQNYVVRVHRHFFSNCTPDHVVLADPPDSTLAVLIFIPVFLALAMVALVVWCSKRSDLLA
ncbi:receptor activity-modifying protein 3 [Scleropages formosus]|nr:receptor activity-modifying protein 3-like [Scleropages formosus]